MNIQLTFERNALYTVNLGNVLFNPNKFAIHCKYGMFSLAC
jgi:hypothetical protein